MILILTHTIFFILQDKGYGASIITGRQIQRQKLTNEYVMNNKIVKYIQKILKS